MSVLVCLIGRGAGGGRVQIAVGGVLLKNSLVAVRQRVHWDSRLPRVYRLIDCEYHVYEPGVRA